MADRSHHLTLTLVAADWADAERQAAKLIRLYTKEPRRGRYAVPDDAVLRDATFRVGDRGGDGLWPVTVEVTV